MTEETTKKRTGRRWRGIPAAPGIALGPAFVHSVRHEQPPIRHLTSLAEVEAEFARLAESLSMVRDDLLRLKGDSGGTVGSALGKIFDAQVMIVDDAAIVAQVKGFIEREQIGAENAYSRVLTEAQQSIARASDPYLREMVNDIEAVKTRVVNCLLGLGASLSTPLSAPVILFADNITPSDIISLKRDCVLGIVTEGGGQTSHTALLAKSLRIPAVVGVGLDVRMVRSGGLVAVDGYNGLVILEPDPATIEFIQRKRKRTLAPWPKKFEVLRELPATTPDKHRVRLMANIDLGREATSVAEAGADGVGLYRTEYLFLEHGKYPSESVQRATYREAVEALGGRPLVVRTFDLGSDKAIPGRSPEPNPALGLRGLRLSLRYPETLLAQFRALLSVSALGPVWVMLPMVIDVEEFLEARKLWQSAKSALKKKGVKFDARTPLGIMVETPSSVCMIEELAEASDFLSIGSNDLLQYTVVADRGNRAVTHPNDRWHPALWRQMAAVIKAGHRARRPVAICGEIATDPQVVPILLGLGIDSLSCHPNSIPKIKSIIRNLRYADARKLVERFLESATLEQGRQLALRFAGQHGIRV
ncbi:MAG: phosphoenolpyruvate--protein phosphotransferase [candidate division Zixibacteria bacterium]|nr:phosphoenolpyruvate--protein phosphotransferase [candidate division Zixibacteria bacterium]